MRWLDLSVQYSQNTKAQGLSCYAFTPVKCVIPLYKGNIVQPEEGELRRFPRFRRNPIDQRAWSINIDKEGQMAQGLRLHSLFEVVAHKKLDPGIILINQKVLQCEVFRLLTYYI